ncbi:hypothetical protein LPW11_00050 [Geomonas sp. RF6]|uniref:hypothetical protein n=1 Tax=Geomonas sp. RF6 TaxID=2897342 RepID=UPI001E55D7CD|nr:hypothetical protein [Geomonas sp. RF6]UFS70601.1 hypothetical protein LPW11_00050 [Geomonas sp. RF6]
MVKNFAFLLMMTLLDGCGAGKLVGKVPVVERESFATVHIARPSGFIGCGVRTTIQIDHSDFYWLACGEHILFRVPAGKAIVVSQITSMRPDHVAIQPEVGKEYFLENDCNQFACWLAESPAATFDGVAARCPQTVKVGF